MTANAKNLYNEYFYNNEKVIEDIREVVRRPPGRFEAIPDNLTAQEIAEQAAAAAKGRFNYALTIN